jgi:hypothetical protein
MKTSQSMVASVLLAPITAATTARTASLDTQNADYATIYVTAGAEVNTNSTNVALNLKESDTDAATAYVTFNSAYSLTLDNTAGAVAALNVDLKGRKRYLQVSVTPDTTTNGAVISSAIGLLRKDISGANSGNAGSVAVG